eukprot:1346845-Pyramimonas_sp.AAC.1
MSVVAAVVVVVVVVAVVGSDVVGVVPDVTVSMACLYGLLVVLLPRWLALFALLLTAFAGRCP